MLVNDIRIFCDCDIRLKSVFLVSLQIDIHNFNDDLVITYSKIVGS
jgi:hypothetical protein